MDPDFSDRRTTIRFPLNSERALSVSEIIETRLLDISLGGVSFRSSKPFEVGNRITIGNDLLSFSATVLETVRVVDEEQDGAKDAWPDYPYRLRCMYADEEDLDDIKILMALVLEEEEDSGQVV